MDRPNPSHRMRMAQGLRTNPTPLAPAGLVTDRRTERRMEERREREDMDARIDAIARNFRL